MNTLLHCKTKSYHAVNAFRAPLSGLHKFGESER